jgi:hypothetical protein
MIESDRRVRSLMGRWSLINSDAVVIHKLLNTLAKLVCVVVICRSATGRNPWYKPPVQ